MPKPTSDAARQFAIEVVTRLRDAGFEAYWAGGCVRDELLGKAPKDFDVATSAEPDQIRELFGKRRTIAIGAVFGVITVLGPPEAGQVEVATFRSDAAYSDGRRPDAVTFGSAAADAQRRDFTVNGLFFDPLQNRVIDFVGGQADLVAGCLRAIGDPAARISEDKLRMLRAVRLATTLGFRIDDATWDAVCHHANEIRIVSPERITQELRRLLVHRRSADGWRMLHRSGLLREFLPEAYDANSTSASSQAVGENAIVEAGARVLAQLVEPTFSVALAAIFQPIVQGSNPAPFIAAIAPRWRLSNDEKEGLSFCLSHVNTICKAVSVPWPRLQRILIRARIGELILFANAVAGSCGIDRAGLELCEERLGWPPERLNPPPLVDGNVLMSVGIPAGPELKRMLEDARDAQIDGVFHTQEEACQWVKQAWNKARA